MSPQATALEIRDAYRRLILLAHPDRAGAVGLANDPAASLLNVAYETLSDPARRRAYDQQLARQRPNAARTRNVRTVDLSAFDEPLDDAAPYTLACRCGATFAVTVEQLEAADGELSLACAGCSERIAVLFEVVDDAPA